MLIALLGPAGRRKSGTGIASMPVSMTELKSSAFITASALRTLVGLSIGTGIEPVTWFRFVTEGGSVLVVPKTQITYKVSWQQLDDIGVSQGAKVVSIGGLQYKVRLLHCGPLQGATLAGASQGALTEAIVKGSEWYNLFNSVRATRPTDFAGPKLATYSDTDLQSSNGSLQSTFESLTGDASQGTNMSVNMNGYFRTKTSTDNSRGWRPCLELVK